MSNGIQLIKNKEDNTIEIKRTPETDELLTRMALLIVSLGNTIREDMKDCDDKTKEAIEAVIELYDNQFGMGLLLREKDLGKRAIGILEEGEENE